MSESNLSFDGDRPVSPSASRSDSAHGSRRIDVNSNAAFRSLSPDIPAARSDSEVQGHFKLSRRHGELIDDFTFNRNPERHKNRTELLKSTYDPLHLDIPVTREQLNHYRTITENARSELAALQVKYESAQSELLDLRSKLSVKEVCLQEHKAEIETYKEYNARQSSKIASLHARMQETEEESSLLASSKTRADLSLQTVLQENCEMKEKIKEFQSRLNTYLTQWEDSRSQASRYSRNHGQLLSQLSSCLDVDVKGKDDQEEMLISKVKELLKQNTALKGCTATLEETINVHETESKASRETIMKLVKEMNKEQKRGLSCTQQIDKLEKNLEIVTDAKQGLEREIRLLQDRLTASQRAWEVSKQELNEVKKNLVELDVTLKNKVEQGKASQCLLQSFKEEVATALSRDSLAVKPKEETILERIRDLCSRAESKRNMVTHLETRVCKMNEQLQSQTDLHHEALHRAKWAEQQLEDLRGCLKLAEGELVSGDVMRDTLSTEKQKYMKFLELLSDKMKLERVTADVGFDMRLDAILARTDQLVKLQADAVVENKTLANGLQRKLKAQKEKIDSKELHMELLRKKIAQLEEEKHVRTALAVERDEANLTVRKLQKKVERLQKDLNATQESSTELKARLSDTNDLKIKTLEQHKTIGELNKSLEQIERTKDKTQKKLIAVKSELDFTEKEAKEEKGRAANVLEVVTSELKILKRTLEEVSKREKQLVDFREVVSRMLGLNINILALPDYEIIKRLEGLIHTHHHHAVSCA